MQFTGFAGNGDVKNQLSLAFDEGRLPHAIILEGPAGCGKRTLAAILAEAAVCSGEDKPCGTCPGCMKAKANTHPDIYTASGGTAARSFHVDTIRFIRSDAYIKPNEAPCKVYLLLQADTMSEQAQNALLKVLEEPPAQVLFVLTCVSSASLLSTVRSRSQVFTLEPAPLEEAVETVSRRMPEIPLEQIRAAADSWGGNIGRMLEALQNGGPSAAVELAPQILSAITAPEEFPILRLTAPLIKDKDLLRAVLDRLLQLFRDACVLRAGGRALCREPQAEELCAALTRERLLSLITIAMKARQDLNRNANPALLVTALCANLRAAAGR